MCSEKDDRVLSALKSINHPQTARVLGQNGPPVARLFCKNKFEYLMRKTRVTVGRTSAKSAADVDMGSSTYISRNHLEIYTTESRFFVLVTGKNGVFIDGVFHRKGSAPFELQRVALLRFPSTDITIQFHILLEEESAAHIKCSSLPFVDDVVVKENSQSNVFKPSSPVDGPVVPNSLSIVTSTEVKQEVVVPMSVNSEEVVTKPRSKEHVAKETKVVISDDVISSNRSKPPFSYAQLIVQAISSQKDKQLTLSGIYSYISQKYPYYRLGDKGWQNSIRHNLSLNHFFIRVPRAQEESGKGSFWRIGSDSEAVLTEQAFKCRRPRMTQNSSKASQADATTPSLTSMSSVEVDGNGTPEDSCMSWEESVGGGTDETNELVIPEEVTSQPVVFQGNGTSVYEAQADAHAYEEPLQQVAGTFTRHTLPQLVSKPQFFLAKPQVMSGTLIQGMVPLQLPLTMAGVSGSTPTATAGRSNDLNVKDVIGDNKVFMVPDKPASLLGFVQRPQLMQGYQPRTVIVRMNSNTVCGGPVPTAGGQIMRFAFGLPTMDSQNLVPVVGVKTDSEEMETDGMVSSVSASTHLPSSEVVSGDRHRIQLQTISN